MEEDGGRPLCVTVFPVKEELSLLEVTGALVNGGVIRVYCIGVVFFTISVVRQTKTLWVNM